MGPEDEWGRVVTSEQCDIMCALNLPQLHMLSQERDEREGLNGADGHLDISGYEKGSMNLLLSMIPVPTDFSLTCEHCDSSV